MPMLIFAHPVACYMHLAFGVLRVCLLGVGWLVRKLPVVRNLPWPSSTLTNDTHVISGWTSRVLYVPFRRPVVSSVHLVSSRLVSTWLGRIRNIGEAGALKGLVGCYLLR
ncbi:hypothetical protein V8F20_003792 [Naviculisporaceae sp. PSN 640]